MIRFYGLSERDCMAMPLSRFMALYGAISYLRMEEEAYQLSIIHNNDPGKRIKEIAAKLRPNDHNAQMPVGAMLLLNTPGVRAEEEAGSILKLRERQKESAARLKAEFELEKQQAEARGEKLVVFPQGIAQLHT